MRSAQRDYGELLMRCFRGVRIALLGTLFGLGKSATACAICTSNLSYNAAKFSVLWLLIFVVWLLILLVWRWYRRASPEVTLAFKPYVRAFGRYAIVVAVLYLILGAHLAAIMLFPLILLIQWIKRSRDIRAADGGLWIRLKYANFAVVGALVVTVPVGHFLPLVVSEPETRVRQGEAIASMRKVLDAEDRKIAAAKTVDPFSYEVFAVPGYDWLMQGSVFFRVEDGGFKVSDVNGKAIVYSRGPNGVFDLSPEIIREAMGSTSDTARLAIYTYDPTNGMVGSNGDVWVAR